jgi:hypothetical protein
MQAANESAAMYFLKDIGARDKHVTYEVRANGGLYCEMDTGDGHARVYVEEGMLHESAHLR